MKLAVLFALVTLALCCSSVSAGICPAFLHVIQQLLMGTVSDYIEATEPFNPDFAMRNSGVLMKESLDKLPQMAKENVMKLTKKIISSPQCN
ncbi:uteroglobin [Echinops telfairi]|uniref:Uteroglobin n=1 Tax=Echinops telfairi TaxID=9371 RepID=A0AC55DN33_ECHTE|nr:uteroglobin [Echinops telfairi]